MAGMLVCLTRSTRCKSFESSRRQAGKERIRKIDSRMGGGNLIAEDQGPGPGPGPGPAFVVPNRNRHDLCGGHRRSSYLPLIQS